MRFETWGGFKVKRLFMPVVRGVLALGCVWLGLGQGQNVMPPSARPPANPPAPSSGSNNAPNDRTPNPGSSVAAVDPHKYVLGPEDVIFIRTWREPDFTFQAVIRPDGKISVPLIQEVQAGNLTPEQLTANLKEQLSKYLNNPDITISVTEVHSKKYFIDGQVSRTGPFPLVSPTTVLEALSNAGGFRDFANTKDIRILRGGKVLHFNWNQVTSGKKLDQNIMLENGDHIIVR